MADVQTQSPDPAPPIASLTGDMPPSSSSAIADLTKLKKQQLSEESKAISASDAALSRDQARMEAAYKAEGVEPEALKPWDADKEHKKFESDPIQGIGSVGSIFAVIASAFTKAPATNAIQGMAGAINAIKEGNEDAYKRAYDSYKQNIKLALDRQKIEHEQYQDAATLMQSNIAAGQAKMHNLAVKFGDQNTLMLLEHGMSKELIEMQAARVKSAEQLQELNEKNIDHSIRMNAYDQLKQEVPKGATPEQAQQIAAQNLNAWRKVNNIKEAYNTPEQEVTARVIHENPKATGPELADKLEEAGVKVGKQTERDKIIQERVYFEEQAIRDREGRDPTAAESAKIREQAAAMGRASGGTGSGSTLTNDRTINKDAEEHKTRMKQEHPDWSPEKLDTDRDSYVKSRQIATKAPTSHDIHQDDTQYAKAERMEHTMDQMDELLLKHSAITGIGGTLTRPVEAISNILGSNETDRKQFQRFATELKEWGQSVVNDRTGRPLSSEAKDAAVIFAGLNPGDTSANTVRAIVELRPVIKQIKEQIRARGRGQGPVSGGGDSASAGAEKQSTAPKWQSAPLAEGQ